MTVAGLWQHPRKGAVCGSRCSAQQGLLCTAGGARSRTTIVGRSSTCQTVVGGVPASGRSGRSAEWPDAGTPLTTAAPPAPPLSGEFPDYGYQPGYGWDIPGMPGVYNGGTAIFVRTSCAMAADHVRREDSGQGSLPCLVDITTTLPAHTTRNDPSGTTDYRDPNFGKTAAPDSRTSAPAYGQRPPIQAQPAAPIQNWGQTLPPATRPPPTRAPETDAGYYFATTTTTTTTWTRRRTTTTTKPPPRGPSSYGQPATRGPDGLFPGGNAYGSRPAVTTAPPTYGVAPPAPATPDWQFRQLQAIVASAPDSILVSPVPTSTTDRLFQGLTIELHSRLTEVRVVPLLCWRERWSLCWHHDKTQGTNCFC